MGFLTRPAKRWFPDASFYADHTCSRCGVCCGSTDGDPCEHLQLGPDGYFCEVYATRFGPHRTINGNLFTCVPIQKMIDSNGGYAACSYVAAIREIREQRGEPFGDLGLLETPVG